MSNALEVAALLDEIAKNADPYSILRNSSARLLGNSRKPMKVMYMSQPDLDGKSWTMIYYLPVGSTMEGITGTPEEVVEWLKTGLTADQDFSIVNSFPGGPHFALKCIYRDPILVNDLHELQRRTTELIVEKIIPLKM